MGIEERLESIERLLLTMSEKTAEVDALSIDRVVEVYGLKKSFLYSLVHRREIPHYKVGRLLFFSKKEIEAFILSNRVSTYDEAESFAASYIAKPKVNQNKLTYERSNH